MGRSILHWRWLQLVHNDIILRILHCLTISISIVDGRTPGHVKYIVDIDIRINMDTLHINWRRISSQQQ